MKKIALLISSVLMLSAAQDVAGWKFSGDIRTGWVQYDYGNPPKGIDNNGNIIPKDPTVSQGHTDSQGWYVIPKFSLQTPSYKNFYFKATVAAATDFGINDEKYESRTFVFDSKERKSFAILQEAQFVFENKEHKILVGREEFLSPMFDADDYYMQADSFQLAYYKNNSFENTTLMVGYFDKFAGVWDSGANGTKFESMSQASYIDSADKAVIGDKGFAFASLDYNNKKHHLQLWNYYGFDMYNIFYAQYDFLNSAGALDYDFGIKWINFKEVGYLASDAAKTDIDYSLYEARFDGTVNKKWEYATGVAKYTSGPGQGATLGAFGGYYYFANGMVFHFFEAGSLQNAASYKGQIGYNFGKFGSEEMKLYYRYTYFNLDPNYSKTASGLEQNKMQLNGIRLVYGDQLGWYFTGTYEHVRLDNEPNTYALRLIGGYRF